MLLIMLICHTYISFPCAAITDPAITMHLSLLGFLGLPCGISLVFLSSLDLIFAQDLLRTIDLLHGFYHTLSAESCNRCEFTMSHKKFMLKIVVSYTTFPRWSDLPQ